MEEKRLSKIIRNLKNPKTELYFNFKEFILSNEFPWFYNSISVNEEKYLNHSNFANIPFYSHSVLSRPEENKNKFPVQQSQYLEHIIKIILEILNYNGVNVNSFFRISVNCVQPGNEVLTTIPHKDHECEHQNILIYLTNSGGCTFVKDEKHNPKEDDVVIFGGEIHYHETPKKERRIVIVATYI